MKNTPTLHTDHLTLDRFTLEDVPAVRDTLYTEAVCRNLFITPGKTTEEVTENIQWLLDGYATKEDIHQWAVRENGLCVGRRMLPVTRVLHIDFCFDDLGLNRVEADHFARNPASGRVMEKAGMTREGLMRQKYCKDGEFLDAVLYAVLKEDRK